MKSDIQKEPICVYWSDASGLVDSMLFFHGNHSGLSFSEFILYLVIPKVEALQYAGYNVKFGYVNDADHRDGLESYKKFLELEIEYENK